MAKRVKVYLKNTDIWDSIDHEESSELLPGTYARLDTLTYGSRKNLVWKCSKDHSWHASVSTRSKGHGCPYCSGRMATDTNRLSIRNPGVSAEWDYGKNVGVSPEDVTVSSNRKFWWICPQNHSWKAAVNDRSRGRGCPFCSGRRASDSNRLSTNNPELAREWDFDKNELSPYDVSAHSHENVWWLCSESHSWQARVDNRSNGNGCPFCSGQRVTDNNRLSIKNPKLAREWDFDRNELTPSEVSVYSGKWAHWVCSAGHSWRSQVYNRSNGNGCPTCAKKYGKIENRFIESFTEQTDFTVTAHGMRLTQLKYESGYSGVEVDIILYRNNHYLLLEYDGSYWHRDKSELDTEKSRLLLSLGDNILHARIREGDLPELDLAHDRFAQFRHDYHKSESDSIEHTVKEIERWFMEKIGE